MSEGCGLPLMSVTILNLVHGYTNVGRYVRLLRQNVLVEASGISVAPYMQTFPRLGV